MPQADKKIVSLLAQDDVLTVVRNSAPDDYGSRDVASVTWFTPTTGNSVSHEFYWINRHTDLVYRGLSNGSLVVAGEAGNGNSDIALFEKNGSLRPVGSLSGQTLGKANTHIEVNDQVLVAARNEVENTIRGVRVKQFDLPK